MNSPDQISYQLSTFGLLNLNNENSQEAITDVKLNYPKRKPFVKYLEKLVAPESNKDKPLLLRRPQTSYLIEQWPANNTFSLIKHERIKELKRQANDRRQAELKRCRQEGKIITKIPKAIRQRYTAHSHLKDLIFEENLNEVHKYGMLYGPPNLTLQPSEKHGVQLITKNQPEKPDIKSVVESLASLPNQASATSKPTTSSFSGESSHKDSILGDSFSKEEIRPRLSGADRVSNRASERDTETFDHINNFIADRKKICMIELACRTKEGEIDRLNRMLDDETQFLEREEKELLLRHDEHDRYLKTICQRTAEAIHLAENEAHKRNTISDRIKRTRYKLAHLNAECIKMEEEFLRLSTYKEFLDSVAKTFQENRATEATSADNLHDEIEKPIIKAEKTDDTDKFNSNSSAPAVDELETDGEPQAVADNTESTKKGSITEKSMKTIDKMSECSVNSYFKSPHDLVDILSELESNNLTLIENVQEQEESCERVRLKAARLQKTLNLERITVDEHINREKRVIANLKQDVEDVNVSKVKINEFTLLERYEKIFNLGSIYQFEASWVQEEYAKRANGDDEVKPTVGNLLEILHDQIHLMYSKIFGTEGGARLDTLMMLKVLETTIDDLSRTLSGYSRAKVLKAKRTVDEQNRFVARQRQKELEALAHDARLKKAIQKATEPPRWHRGRRVLERSHPPEKNLSKVVTKEQADIEDEDACLFQL